MASRRGRGASTPYRRARSQKLHRISKFTSAQVSLQEAHKLWQSKQFESSPFHDHEWAITVRNRLIVMLKIFQSN